MHPPPPDLVRSALLALLRAGRARQMSRLATYHRATRMQLPWAGVSPILPMATITFHRAVCSSYDDALVIHSQASGSDPLGRSEQCPVKDCSISRQRECGEGCS